jgi:S-adenosylmethionine/arginine decarboxylase-like enzyme
MSYVEPWGWHAMFDCAGCDILSITDKKKIQNFATELVRAIDMVAFDKPYVVRFGHGNKAGYTLVQLIETSTITGHFCESTGDAFIDVFSCKPFDPATAADVVNRYFLPAHINQSFLYRIASAK